MSTVVVYKDESGKLAGFGEKGSRAWEKFRRTVEDLEVGETLDFEWRKPRSPKFHRLHFVMLHTVFESQEQFQQFDQFRMWVQVGSGHADLLPGPNGKPVAVPRSIAWAALDDIAFGEHHLEALRFLRSAHATRFLWPDLPDVDADSRVNALLGPFEQ